MNKNDFRQQKSQSISLLFYVFLRVCTLRETYITMAISVLYIYIYKQKKKIQSHATTESSKPIELQQPRSPPGFPAMLAKVLNFASTCKNSTFFWQTPRTSRRTTNNKQPKELFFVQESNEKNCDHGLAQHGPTL